MIHEVKMPLGITSPRREKRVADTRLQSPSDHSQHLLNIRGQLLIVLSSGGTTENIDMSHF
jgi:hypothetical protein